MKTVSNMILFFIFATASSSIFSAHNLDSMIGSEVALSPIDTVLSEGSEEILNATQALCRYPTEHALSPRERSLEGADLREKNLWFADLEGFNLDMADISKSKLTMASVMRTSLRRSNLSGAKMQFGNFFGADFSGANVEEADFRGANFSQANLFGVDLSSAKLEGADMTFAICEETPGLPKYIQEIGCSFFKKEALIKAGARFNKVPWTETEEGMKLLKHYQNKRKNQVTKHVQIKEGENENDPVVSKSKSHQRSQSNTSSQGKSGSLGKLMKLKLFNSDNHANSFQANDENSENGSSKSYRNSQGRNGSGHNSLGRGLKAQSPKKDDSLSRGSAKPGLIRTNSKNAFPPPTSNLNKRLSGSRGDLYQSAANRKRRESVIGLFPQAEESIRNQ